MSNTTIHVISLFIVLLPVSGKSLFLLSVSFAFYLDDQFHEKQNQTVLAHFLGCSPAFLFCSLVGMIGTKSSSLFTFPVLFRYLCFLLPLRVLSVSAFTARTLCTAFTARILRIAFTARTLCTAFTTRTIRTARRSNNC